MGKFKKTAVAYARYSSNNQREESIDAQLRAIHEYCEKENTELIAEFTDEAISGKSDNRCQAGKPSISIVWSVRGRELPSLLRRISPE